MKVLQSIPLGCFGGVSFRFRRLTPIHGSHNKLPGYAVWDSGRVSAKTSPLAITRFPIFPKNRRIFFPEHPIPWVRTNKPVFLKFAHVGRSEHTETARTRRRPGIG